MSDAFVSVAAAVLAATFAWAGLAKLALPRRWAAAASGYGLARSVEATAVVAVPVLELGVAALAVAGRTRAAGALAVALVAAFSAVVARAGSSGRARLPCGCFGASRARDYRLMLARNAVLAAVAAVVLAAGRDVGPADLPAIDAGDAAPAALVAVALVTGWWTLRHALQHLRGRPGA